jgi:hypothetical protein
MTTISLDINSRNTDPGLCNVGRNMVSRVPAEEPRRTADTASEYPIWVRIIAFYVLVCVVRMTMPGLQARDRNLIFLIRMGFAALGTGAAYGLLGFSLHGYLVRGPYPALTVAVILFGLFAAIGEYVTRKKLRSLNIFPAHKNIPWTY